MAPKFPCWYLTTEEKFDVCFDVLNLFQTDQSEMYLIRRFSRFTKSRQALLPKFSSKWSEIKVN